MVTNCVVNKCHNASDIKKSLSFHGFPFRYPDVLKLWISACGRENWYPSKSSKICGEHFLPTDYQLLQGYTKKRLKIDAVPKVFNIPENLTITSEVHIKTEAIDESMDDFDSPDFISNSTSTETLNTFTDSEGTTNYPVIDLPSTYVAIQNTFSVSQDSNIHPVMNLPSTFTNRKTFVDRATQTSENYHSSINLKRKLKTLQQKIKRRDIKIATMKQVINEIKKHGTSNERLKEVLKNYFEQIF